MYKNHSIAVIVPAFNEEKLIGKVIGTMPYFVDKIVVIDDNSNDNTSEIVKNCISNNKRLELIQHKKNLGVGGAIISGYKYALDRHFDISVVMAGDAQMDPDDLPSVLNPVITAQADYAKGTRITTRENRKKIPRSRLTGICALTVLSKIVTGYWQISDFQCGYTAINNRQLRKIDLDKIYHRYGMPNDILARLKTVNSQVVDVPVKPIYNIGEKSGIRYTLDIPRISFLLFKLAVFRVIQKLKFRTNYSASLEEFQESLQL